MFSFCFSFFVFLFRLASAAISPTRCRDGEAEKPSNQDGEARRPRCRDGDAEAAMPERRLAKRRIAESLGAATSWRLPRVRGSMSAGFVAGVCRGFAHDFVLVFDVFISFSSGFARECFALPIRGSCLYVLFNFV